MVELAEEQPAGSKAGPRAQEPGSSPAETDSACRSETYLDQAPGNWALVALLAVAAAGTLIGYWAILWAPEARRLTAGNVNVALRLWAELIGIFSGFGLAAGVIMTLWSWQLLKTFQPRVPRMSAFRWAVATVLVLAMAFGLDTRLPAAMVGGQPCVVGVVVQADPAHRSCRALITILAGYRSRMRTPLPARPGPGR